VSPMRAEPADVESRPAMQCMRVDLPEPRGAHDRGAFGLAEIDRYVVDGDDARLALPVDLVNSLAWAATFDSSAPAGSRPGRLSAGGSSPNLPGVPRINRPAIHPAVGSRVLPG
jgi:hypothetical protein